jgi:secreted trypsin-like serine protease
VPGAAAAALLLIPAHAGLAQPVIGAMPGPGQAATAGRYPYVAAFSRQSGDRRVYFCAGTLVAPRWIATAAHCFFAPGGQRIGAADLWAEVGRDRLRGVDEDAQMRIARIVVHPDYDPASQANDIALVELDEIAGPLTAAPAARDDPALDATALGFASLYEGELAVRGVNTAGTLASQLSDGLRQVRLFLLDPARCAGLGGPDGAPGGRTICAGTDARDTCVGDSGGPLVETSPQGEDRLIGIVSLGSGCATASPVVVYTRVAAYAGWIAATIAS